MSKDFKVQGEFLCEEKKVWWHGNCTYPPSGHASSLLRSTLRLPPARRLRDNTDP